MLFECLITSCIYGITPIMEKHLLQFIEIETFILLNGLIIFLFCSVYWVFFVREKIWKDIKVISNNYFLIFLLFFTAFFIYIVAIFLYMKVLKHNKTYVGTALIASYPIITVILGYLVFSEEISFIHMIAIFMITFGVILLNY